MIWTVFLPLGRRFSVDAIRASLRARPDETPAELAAGVPPPDDAADDLAGGAGAAAADRDHLLVQLRPQERADLARRDRGLLRPVAGADRHLAGPADPRARPVRRSPSCSPRGRWSIEASARVPDPVADLLALDAAPRGAAAVRPARRHRGDGEPRHLLGRDDRLRAVPARPTAQWKLLAPAGADARPRAHGLLRRRLRRLLRGGARAGAAWTCTGACAWSPTATPPRCPRGVDRELLDRTILVVDPARDRRWTRADAFAQILAALPLGRLWAWPLRLPGLQRARRASPTTPSRATARASRPGSAWPPAACRARRASSRAPAAAAETPLRAWLRAQAAVRCASSASRVMFVVLAAEVSVANPSVPRALPLRASPRMDGRGGHVPAHLRGLVAVLARRAALRRDRRTSTRSRATGATSIPTTRSAAGSSTAGRARPGPPRPRLVLVRLHAAHPRRRRVPPGAHRVDPALPRAHRATRTTRSSASTPT